jgi:hypothetical protein
MDISTEKYDSVEYRLAPISAVLETARKIIRRMVEFFTITEEDCVNAGVHFDEEQYG